MHNVLMCIHIMQITEEDIDIRKVISRFQTGDTKPSKILEQLEDLKQYPPRLSLEVFRSQRAREHLMTDVKINGIEPQLICKLITSCPGMYVYLLYINIKYYIVHYNR